MKTSDKHYQGYMVALHTTGAYYDLKRELTQGKVTHDEYVAALQAILKLMTDGICELARQEDE